MPVRIQIGAWCGLTRAINALMFELNVSEIWNYWKEELCFRITGEKTLVFVDTDFR